MGRILSRTALVMSSSWALLGACGQSDQDLFDDPETTSATSSTSTSTNTESSSTTSSSSSGMTAAGGTGGSTLTTSTGTTAGVGGAASSTTSTSDSTTTGTMNDPQCPGSAPEGTSMCNVMVGLSCSYGEETCVCSGLTWNCFGGEDEGTSGTGGGGNFGSSNDGDMFGGTGDTDGMGGSSDG